MPARSRRVVHVVVGMLALAVAGLPPAACSTVSDPPSTVAPATETTHDPLGTTTTSIVPADPLVPGNGSPLGLVYPDLPGTFPDTVEVGDQVLHARMVFRESDSWLSQTDFWQQPATGKFRKSTVSFGGDSSVERESVQVFTGERLQGYEVGSGPESSTADAYDVSYAAYEASILEDKVDPFSKDQGEIGERIFGLRRAAEEGLLRDADRGMVDGREVVRYEGRFSIDHAFPRATIADAVSDFPLDDRLYGEDGTVFSCTLADLEVVADPDWAALFGLSFPVGAEVMTDDRLPQMPEQAVGLEACLQELEKLSGEVPFPLYYLGESFDGLPLYMVEPGWRADEIPSRVILHYEDPRHESAANVFLSVYDVDLVPHLKKPFEGWEVVQTVEVDGHAESVYGVGSGHLFYVAKRGQTSIDLTGWNDQRPLNTEELIEAAGHLTLFRPLAP